MVKKKLVFSLAAFAMALTLTMPSAATNTVTAATPTEENAEETEPVDESAEAEEATTEDTSLVGGYHLTQVHQYDYAISLDNPDMTSEELQAYVDDNIDSLSLPCYIYYAYIPDYTEDRAGYEYVSVTEDDNDDGKCEIYHYECYADDIGADILNDYATVYCLGTVPHYTYTADNSDVVGGSITNMWTNNGEDTVTEYSTVYFSIDVDSGYRFIGYYLNDTFVETRNCQFTMPAGNAVIRPVFREFTAEEIEAKEKYKLTFIPADMFYCTLEYPDMTEEEAKDLVDLFIDELPSSFAFIYSYDEETERFYYLLYRDSKYAYTIPTTTLMMWFGNWPKYCFNGTFNYYQVNIEDEGTHGTLSLTSSREEGYSPLSTVFVTAEADEGYRYTGAYVNDEFISDMENFKMPKTDVTIRPVFEKIMYNVKLDNKFTWAGETYDGTYPDGQYATYEAIYPAELLCDEDTTFEKVYIGTGGSGKVKVYMGLTDKESFTDKNDYFTSGDFPVVYEGEAYSSDGWMEIPLDQPFEYKAGKNLAIIICKQRIDEDEGAWYGISASNVDGISSLLYYTDDASDSSHADIPAENIGNYFTFDYNGEVAPISFKVPDTVSVDKTSAGIDDVVTMTAITPEDYELDYFTVNGVKQTENTFVMPAGDVVVGAVIKPIPYYNISCDKSVTTDKAKAKAGETVTMTAKLGRYDIVDKYYVNGVAQDSNTFVMPAGNVTVSATILYTVPKPQKDIRTFYYTGSKYQFYPLYYYAAKKTYFSANGLYYDVYNDTRTEPGTQTVTVKLKKGYAWSDGSTDDLTFEFTVKKGTQENAFVYYLKDLSTKKIVGGFTNASYVYDRDFADMKYVFTHYAPNIYNVRDNATVTYEYSNSFKSKSFDWYDNTNTFCYQGLGSIDDENHISKWLPDEVEKIAEEKVSYIDKTMVNVIKWKKALVIQELWSKYNQCYSWDNGSRYLTIHIAATDHYDGLTIYPSGYCGTYNIYKSCATVESYELDGYINVNNGQHWDYYNPKYPVESTVLNYLGSDDPVREPVNLLTMLSTSFEARNEYYSFIAGGNSDYAQTVSTRNFYNYSDAVSYAKQEQNYGAAAEDITLSNGQKFRLSRSGYKQLNNVSTDIYGTNEVTEVTELTEEDDSSLDSLELDKLTDITETMSDETVGDELLEGEVTPEEIKETVEVEEPDQSGTQDIELDESYVIEENQLVNLDLGDCDIDITGMGDIPVYEVKAGGALIIRSSQGGKITSSDDISKFVQVDEGGMLIVYGNDILDESLINCQGYRLYPVLTDASYDLDEDGKTGSCDFQYREVGDKVTQPEDPEERDGYVFGGWYKDEACTEKWDFDNDTLTEEDLADGMFVLYARWIKQCEGDHDFVSEVTTEPTCTEEGVRTYTCTHEDYSYTEPIPATGHSFTEYVYNNDATCTEDGTKTAICDNGCGETDTIVDEGTALGHDYQTEVTKVPTKKEDGVRTYTCTRCKDTYTEAIPVLKIIAQPANYYGPLSTTAAFAVNAQGEGLTYQWQYSYCGCCWHNMSSTSATTNMMSIEILARRNHMFFRCVVKDAYGNTVISRPVVLIVDCHATLQTVWKLIQSWGICCK